MVPPIFFPTKGIGMTQQSDEDDSIDYDRLALEQIAKGEPDELDGPAADLDRTLDDANPDADRR